VLELFDVGTQTLLRTNGSLDYTVRPCTLESCDPKLPYRVAGSTAKFLTLECDQGVAVTGVGCPVTNVNARPPPGAYADVNCDGRSDDLLIQSYNESTNVTHVVGTVGQSTTGSDAGLGDPLSDPTDGSISSGGTQVFTSPAGHCVENLGPPTTTCAP